MLAIRRIAPLWFPAWRDNRDKTDGYGVSPVSAARSGKCSDRVDAGLLGLEFEAHGRIASAVRKIAKILRLTPKNSGFEPFRLGFVNIVGSSPTGG